LRKFELLSKEGEPIGYAGLITHIQWTEPMNFVLCSLLRSGIIDQICSGGPQQENCNSLMLILCHLFHRHKARPKIPWLDRLPETVTSVINRHNELTMQIWMAFILQTCRLLNISDPEPVLPLSQLCFQRNSDGLDNEVVKNIIGQSVSYEITSPFVALSGKADNFESAKDLLDCCRSGVALNLPSIPVFDNYHEPAMSHIYDFFRGASFEELTANNPKLGNSLWTNLHDFDLLLRAIAVAVQHFISDGTHPVVVMFKRLKRQFGVNFKKTKQVGQAAPQRPNFNFVNV